MKKFITGTRQLMIYTCNMLFFVGTLFSQEKPCLAESDYSLWGTTQLYAASDDAQWAAYHTRYENGKDTLTLQHTQTGKKYHYPQGASVLFGVGGLAFVFDAHATLHLRDLDNGLQQAFKGVKSYGLNVDSSCLFMLQNDTLSVIGLTTHTRRVIPGVSTYSYNAPADALAYTAGSSNRNRVGVLHLSPKRFTEPIIITETDDRVYTNPVWSRRGGEIAFEQHPLNAAQGTKGAIGFYELKRKVFFEFDASGHPNFPEDKIISCTFLKPLSISDDGSKVFFGIVADTVDEGNPVVDIWNTADKFIHPVKEEIRNWDAVAKVAVWWPKAGRFYTPAHNYPTGMLTGNQKVLLSFDPGQYEPQNNFRGPVDITLTFLETGEQKKILDKWAYSPPYLQVSPAGRYILYWKENHWWIYDIDKDTHRNLTLAIADSESGLDYERPGTTPVLGLAGWNSDDTNVFVYGRHDIWKLATDGSNAIRLTKSKGASTFRFAVKPEGKVNLDGSAPQVIDTNVPIAVKESADTYTSLYTWQKKKGLVKLVIEAGEIANVIPCKTTNNWVYVFHNYQVAPTVRLAVSYGPKTVYSSNIQQGHFAWGRAELIGYEDSSGNKLKGILYYPANYNPDRKYPMVVHIYETQSHGFFDYINPSLYNYTGFNITNLVAQGYFVLLPDITYQIGNPGYSALDCTRAAVQKTLETVPVDSNRIGLIGHSWGGYQTDYIISKTPMFKTAVAGAAITDLRSNYFTVAWNNYIPNYYQSESDQVRLGIGYYDNPELYIKNSPLSCADKITTPLLSWAGKQDKQVDINQTIALHMALRRLGKKNVMLLYPEERHVLMQKEHQEDLTRRTESWLAHYLKGEAEPSWCKADILK